MRSELEQFVTPVYRFALRLTTGDSHAAEDITQEAVLKALQASHRGRSLPAGDEARVWLFTILANVWRDRLRRERVRRAAPIETAPDVAATGRHAGDAQLREDADAALRLLDALPDRQREVFYLSVCAGLSHGQIATVLGISPGAAKASLSLARQRLGESETPECMTTASTRTTV